MHAHAAVVDDVVVLTAAPFVPSDVTRTLAALLASANETEQIIWHVHAQLSAVLCLVTAYAFLCGLALCCTALRRAPITVVDATALDVGDALPASGAAHRKKGDGGAAVMAAP